jgi:hypothetical protein
MCRKWILVGLLLVLSACVVSSYAVSLAQERIVKGDPTPLPGAAIAREAALAYVRDRVERLAPPAGTEWTERDETPEGLLGSSITRLTAGDWTVIVAIAMVHPADVIYHVTVSSGSLGFQWEGQVRADGATAPSA